MAAARMRHHNSPEELARRSAEPDPAARKGREFRHYNHPDEVARRAAGGNPGGSAVVPRRIVATTGVPVWPPAGTVDNTASVDVETAPEKPPTEPPPGRRGDIELRLRRIENLLWTFVESAEEAREFRRLLNNQHAVTDVQLDINNRVRALEDMLEAAMAEQNDDAPTEPELPPLEDDPAPALGTVGTEDGQRLPDPSLGIEPAPETVPDNPSLKGEP